MDTRRIRAALFVDFDNIFCGLRDSDLDAARAFAEQPADWVERLATVGLEHGDHRDFLVRRCYMNPNGSAPGDGETKRSAVFSRFRPAFTKAGFEVVDCPALTSQQKNAADMRIALDVWDSVVAPDERYDEYVIASADADFTPLLLRLRARDRRATIVAAGHVAGAYEGVATMLVDEEQTVALVLGRTVAEPPVAKPASPKEIAAKQVATKPAAAEPTGSVAAAQTRAVTPPEPASAAFPTAEVRRIASVPQLGLGAWRALFETIATVGPRAGAKLGDVAVVVRDLLADEDVRIGRGAITEVLRHCRAGGALAGADAGDTAADLALAYVLGVAGRCAVRDVELDIEQVELMRGAIAPFAPPATRAGLDAAIERAATIVRLPGPIASTALPPLPPVGTQATAPPGLPKLPPAVA